MYGTTAVLIQGTTYRRARASPRFTRPAPRPAGCRPSCPVSRRARRTPPPRPRSPRRDGPRASTPRPPRAERPVFLAEQEPKHPVARNRHGSREVARVHHAPGGDAPHRGPGLARRVQRRAYEHQVLDQPEAAPVLGLVQERARVTRHVAPQRVRDKGNRPRRALSAPFQQRVRERAPRVRAARLRQRPGRVDERTGVEQGHGPRHRGRRRGERRRATARAPTVRAARQRAARRRAPTVLRVLRV